MVSESLCVRAGMREKLSAVSHLDKYENTTLHHLHSHILLTLRIKGERGEGKKATNTTKRSVSKMLSNG